MQWIPASVPAVAHAGVMLAVGAYALAKERQESGCKGWSVSRRQCADENSVYVRGTAPEPGDTASTIKRKLVSILSYHEKGGVWKRCFLLAAVLAYVAWIIQRASVPGWTMALQHLVFFCVLYFWFNYLNYHHYRPLKKHGSALVARLAAHGCTIVTKHEQIHGEEFDEGDNADGHDGLEADGLEADGLEADGLEADGPCMSAYKASRIRHALR